MDRKCATKSDGAESPAGRYMITDALEHGTVDQTNSTDTVSPFQEGRQCAGMPGHIQVSIVISIVIALMTVALVVPNSVPTGQSSQPKISPSIAQTSSTLVPPDQHGSFSVGTWNTSYVDRYSTNVSVVVFYPATKNGDGASPDKAQAPYPLLDFTHGHLFYPPYSYYVSYGDQYASWGYVVSMPNFQAYDGLLTSNHGEMANSTLDLISAMAKKNSSTTGYLEGMVNVNDTALTGHSLGGKISVLAEEYEEALHLTNVKAVETLAMANANSPSTFPQLGTITVPIQVQTGTLDAVAYPSQNSQVVYNGVVTPPKQFVNITGGNHYHYADADPSFGELGDNTSTITRAQQLTLGAKYATAFFNYYLKGEVQYYTYLYGPEAKADLANKNISWNEYANIPPPPMPTKPLNLKAGSGKAQVDLSWTPPTGNTSVPVTNYKIYRGRSSGTETFLTEMGNLTRYNDSGLANCGTYFYNVTAVNTYGNGPSSAEVSAATSCVISFVENGLNAGVLWSVTLGSNVNSSTTNTITFVDPNGKYPFSVGVITGYAAFPPSGNETVNGANVTQSVLFTINGTAVYKLTFLEQGLPTGTTWSVTISSTTTSTTNTIVFNEPNGNYSYTVGNVPPYTASPSSGSACICGANAAVHVNFTTSVTVLDSVALSPTGPTVAAGGTQPITATPSCSSTCPGTITYLWALTSNALGSLSGSGTAVTFTALSTAGTVGLFVNATLSGTTVEASTVITVTVSPTSSLTSVALSPVFPEVGSGSKTTFTAMPSCTSTCPTSGITYIWALSNTDLGSLSGTGATNIFTSGTIAGTVSIYVNATLSGVTRGATTMITVIWPTLDSVSASPSSPSVASGGTVGFTAAPTCTPACPSSGIAYVWTLSSTALGSITGTGASVTFNAGTVAATGGIFVNATLGTTTVESSAVIKVTVTVTVTVALSHVTISPTTYSINSGGQETFTASIACTASNGSSANCPSGTVYKWALSNSDGNVSSTSGDTPSTTFIAGNSSGTEVLTVTASLNGVVQTASAQITITQTQRACNCGPNNMPIVYAAIVAAVVIAGVVVAVLLVRRRRKGIESPQPGPAPQPDGFQGQGFQQ
jgi:dienelactone hydrolase